MPTDEELIEEIEAGSQAALEVLVRKHYKNIFAYIYRKLGDYHLAYDLTQEVFIKVVGSIDRYKHRGNFKHWVLTIAVNHCRDYFRSNTYKSRNEEQQLVTPVRDEQQNIWDLLSKKLDSERVRIALQQLPEYQRESIILKFYHGLKIREIAVMTNSKEATVKSRLKQGIDKLTKIFKGGSEHEQDRAEK